MSHPLLICLPGGTHADLIPGSRPPRYTVDGATVDLDVTIPADLADTWHWHGSFLSDGQIGIFTGTYGVEGAFEEARIHMGLRRTLVIEFGGPYQMDMFDWAA